MTKMDRNINPDGMGKYALVRLDKLNELCPGGTFDRFTPSIEEALATLEKAGALEWGRTGEVDEFFLIKLKDPHATRALDGYADSCHRNDPEFSAEVRELAERSGRHSPFYKEE